uniref:Uncharacterized protein n=1 Tax=Brassica campestris TaxID=3711 RepID=M4DYK1_BRACM
MFVPARRMAKLVACLVQLADGPTRPSAEEEWSSSADVRAGRVFDPARPSAELDWSSSVDGRAGLMVDPARPSAELTGGIGMLTQSSILRQTMGSIKPWEVYYAPFPPRLGVTQSYRRLYSYPALFERYGLRVSHTPHQSLGGLGILRGVHREVLTLVGCRSGSRTAKGEEQGYEVYLNDLNEGGYTPQNREADGLVPAIGDLDCARGGRRQRFLGGMVAAAALDSRRASLGECLMAQL